MHYMIDGKYASAAVTTDQLDPTCISQIYSICNLPYMASANIVIMPDAHAGKGVCIGFTACHRNDFVVPNFIGVDIGCSVSAYPINAELKDVDFAKLDDIIRQHVPSGGGSVRDTPHKYIAGEQKVISDIDKKIIGGYCKTCGSPDAAEWHCRSIGTLGGGNHYIELNVDKSNQVWLTLHTGSRGFGKLICEHYQKLAVDHQKTMRSKEYAYIMQSTINNLQEREKLVQEMNSRYREIPDEQAPLTGEDVKYGYMNAARAAGRFAKLNHYAIAEEIMTRMGWTKSARADTIYTMHNYVCMSNDDRSKYITRKGAIDLTYPGGVIIPMNMQYGSLICVPRADMSEQAKRALNYSAPHGAGRLLSRGKAKSQLTVDEFKKRMEGIWTSCVSQSTLDESPMAYKDPAFIQSVVSEFAVVRDTLRPVYNFKAGD